jgi:phosphatidylglycerol:prolipoprotein diacylglycerol transferase
MIINPINPVALDFGAVQIHWYGVMYLLAFIASYLLAISRIQQFGLPKKAVEDMIFYGALGVVLGWRIGYVLFYNFAYFIENPLAIIYLHQGGMSFHGGFLGVLVAMYVFNKKYHKSFFQTMDFVAPLVPLGLMFGRIGNFINNELWGAETTSSFGIGIQTIQNHLGEVIIRHPSQLYEAFLEGLVLFIILWVFSRKHRPLQSVSALFLIFYGVFRFMVEFVRTPDAHLGYLAFDWLTMGQVLSAPMIVYGCYLLYSAYNPSNTSKK